MRRIVEVGERYPTAGENQPRNGAIEYRLIKPVDLVVGHPEHPTYCRCDCATRGKDSGVSAAFSLLHGILEGALDVAAEGAMDAAVRELVAREGRVDVLVANAGINPQRADALATTDENWDETLRVNLTGLHRSARAVLPSMIDAGRGAIVTVGSIAGQVGMAERAAYGPSKAAVIEYTRNLAIDYAPHGIRACSVCPGFVLTDLVRPWLESIEPERRAAIEGSHPLGIGRPEDVAEAIRFLASDGARWITGVDLSVDGGYTAT